MARGNSRAQSELPSGFEASKEDIRAYGIAERKERDRQALQRTASRIGNGVVGNGTFKDGKLTLSQEDIKYLVENMIGPKNEIADLYDEGRVVNYRFVVEKNESLPFYPENTDKLDANDMAGYFDSTAFKLEPREYAKESNSGSEYNPGSEFVEVDVEQLQVDYKTYLGVDLDDDSAQRLGAALKEALGESIEQWAEYMEDRRRGFR